MLAKNDPLIRQKLNKINGLHFLPYGNLQGQFLSGYPRKPLICISIDVWSFLACQRAHICHTSTIIVDLSTLHTTNMFVKPWAHQGFFIAPRQGWRSRHGLLAGGQGGSMVLGGTPWRGSAW